MSLRMDDPTTKISHLNESGEEKTLEEHINEIKKISFDIANKHFSVDDKKILMHI